MELLATVVEVGAYSERQYQRQDGTTEYFKSRGFTLKHVTRSMENSQARRRARTAIRSSIRIRSMW